MFPDVLDVCEGSQLRSLDKNKSSDLDLTILQDNVLDGGEASSLEEPEMADGGSFLLRGTYGRTRLSLLASGAFAARSSLKEEEKMKSRWSPEEMPAE